MRANNRRLDSQQHDEHSNHPTEFSPRFGAGRRWTADPPPQPPGLRLRRQQQVERRRHRHRRTGSKRPRCHRRPRAKTSWRCATWIRRGRGTYSKSDPPAKPFTDFRRMLDVMDKQIDAVVVATPDHTHAVVAVAAMKRGKHVYCEKPLTRTVHEARVMRRDGRKNKVVTQMGNQGSAAGDVTPRGRTGVGRDHRRGPRGARLVRWRQRAANSARPKRRRFRPPSTGTSGSARRHNAPTTRVICRPPWRGWRAFGSGIVGDFGCHTGNIMFRALHGSNSCGLSPPGQKPPAGRDPRRGETVRGGHGRLPRAIASDAGPAGAG